LPVLQPCPRASTSSFAFIVDLSTVHESDVKTLQGDGRIFKGMVGKTKS